MARGINKDDPKRWILVKLDGDGADSLIVFGNLGEVGSKGLSSRKPVILNYMTEEELEAVVNEIAGDEDYYKNAVETESDKFMMPSGIYEYGLRANDEYEELSFIEPDEVEIN